MKKAIAAFTTTLTLVIITSSNLAALSNRQLVQTEDLKRDLPIEIESKKIGNTEQLLIGEWETPLQSFQEKALQPESGISNTPNSVFRHISFSKDGTYTRSINQLSMKDKETGIYEISEDGQYLTLISSETSFFYVFKIKHIGWEEMVLELQNEDLKKQDFFFNKI